MLHLDGEEGKVNDRDPVPSLEGDGIEGGQRNVRSTDLEPGNENDRHPLDDRAFPDGPVGKHTSALPGYFFYIDQIAVLKRHVPIPFVHFHREFPVERLGCQAGTYARFSRAE